MFSFGKIVEGMKDYLVFVVFGIDLLFMFFVLWCWLCGEDCGEVMLCLYVLEWLLVLVFQWIGVVDVFFYGEDCDLFGYKDGIENFKGDVVFEVVLVFGCGVGLDGGSFVVVQQWLYDFDWMQVIFGEEMDNIIGCCKFDDEELEDVLVYVYVKCIEQESFEFVVFFLWCGVFWFDEYCVGLLFVVFGCLFEVFEVQWLWMIGVEDGVFDGLFCFIWLISGSYFWCLFMVDGCFDLFVFGF